MLSSVGASRDPLADAISLIEKRAARARDASDDELRIRRRLGGILARRGFDAQTSRTAIDRVLSD